ncbi:hypothetical protein NLI96_g9857 [Meripilus lineatus]|uniref:DUF7493 domain-containing protein n=1 Tax=Meripilus lineatus TaxID=2056292 RepID=A0AAD5YCJ3_9APHY|nr:hypothetical protein NLI96_g9857 [Physisporinus lineatus]
MADQPPPSPTIQLVVGDPKHRSIFTLVETTLHVKTHADRKWPQIDTPLRNVLWAEVLNDVFEISLLARRKGKATLSLVRMSGKIEDDKKDEVTRFTQTLLEAAYGGTSRRARYSLHHSLNSASFLREYTKAKKTQSLR